MIKSFANEFIKVDKTFGYDCIKELKLLAGVYLYELAKSNADDYWYIGLFCDCSRGVGNTPVNEEIYTYLQNLLEQSRLNCRKCDVIEDENIDFEEIELELPAASEKEDLEWSSEIYDSFHNSIKEMYDKYNRMISYVDSLKTKEAVDSEASNILWWMVAEWSNYYKIPLKSLDKEVAAFTVATELVQMVNILPGPFSIFSVMQRSLCNAKVTTKKYTIEDCMNKLIIDWCKCVDNKFYVEEIVEFIPVLSIIHNKVKYEQNEATWKSIFEGTFGLKSNEYSKTLMEFSKQLYLECELSKFIQLD